MRELFRMITEADLSPNQFYLLCCMQESISPPKELINLHQELRVLTNAGWLVDNKLQPQSIELISKVDGLFRVQKKKTTKDLLGDNFSEMLDKYLALWDMGKLPSGKPARAAKGNVESAFRWFFENYSYSWDLIIKATKIYIDEYERKTPRYLYMRNSQYFVRKQASDKSWSSDLADYCENVKNGTNESQSDHFSEKVV